MALNKTKKISKKTTKKATKKEVKSKLAKNSSKNKKGPKKPNLTKRRSSTKGKAKLKKTLKRESKGSKKTKPKVAKKIRKKVKKPVSKKTTKKIAKKKSYLSLEKPSENPLIPPNPRNEWEAWQTFNPGVILLNNKVHFIYRAIGSDGLSRLGYAVSSDGFAIDERFPKPVYEHSPYQRQFRRYSYFSGGSWGGSEDPRLVRVDNEEVVHMTYTACNGELRVGLTSIKVNDLLNKKWNWKTPKLISPPGEVHKNWVIFPEKIKGKYAILHSINPRVSIEYVNDLEFAENRYIQSQHGGKPAKNSKRWDNWVRGVGPTPLKTKDGWLVLYHAMDDKDPGKYKVGAMLLDLKNPTKILYRSPEPILEPEEEYENNGYKWGVVYASGAVVKEGKLLVYYGGSDTYVCVAYTNLKKFIEALKKGTKPKLRKKKLKKRAK